VLRRVFGPKRAEIKGGWTKLLSHLYYFFLLFTKHCLGDQIEDEMGGTCSTCGKDDKCISILDGKPKGKRSLLRARRRWKG
jgi:hypothetical protein